MTKRTTQDWLTVAEVATLWRIDVVTVRRWIRRGWLPARRLPGWDYRISRSDAEAVGANRETQEQIPA